jgi:hypothetical protein
VTTTDWYTLLADRPDDWPTRIAFGDWLEEQGNDAAANGQRWQAWKGKYPERTDWASAYWRGTNTRSKNCHCLSSRLLDRMHELHGHGVAPPPGGWGIYAINMRASPEMAYIDAEAALAAALWSLGIVVRGQEVTT